MAKNNSSDTFKDFMQLFDPANVSKAFDPEAMLEKFGVSAASLDPQDTIKKAKGNFEAMTKANEAAAESYRDLMEKQMEIFQKITAEAADQMKAGPPQDVAEAYQDAVNRALQIMTDMSDAARDANARAYDAVKAQVDEAMKDLKT